MHISNMKYYIALPIPLGWPYLFPWGGLFTSELVICHKRLAVKSPRS